MLPTLKIRMIPETRCMKCGCFGYTDDKTSLCGGCLGVSLAIYHKRKALCIGERAARICWEAKRLTQLIREK